MVPTLQRWPAGDPLKVILVLAGLQQAEYPKILCVWAAIYKNQQVILREVDDLGIPRTIVSEILTEDLGMKFLVAKFIQQLQSQEQKDFCAEVP